MQDEEWSGKPNRRNRSEVNQKLRCGGRFTISELADEFPVIGRTTLYNIVTENLRYYKLCAKQMSSVRAYYLHKSKKDRYRFWDEKGVLLKPTNDAENCHLA